MLNSTVTPSAGRALLGGRDVAKDPIGTRAISSVVFQDAVVDQPLTGRQNLELRLKLLGGQVRRWQDPANRTDHDRRDRRHP
jgi:ABC-type multidrug transport system ATPase subunit